DFGFDRSGDETGHVLCSIAVIATASISIRYPGRARAETAIAVTDGAIVLRRTSASKSLSHKHSLVSGLGAASRFLVADRVEALVLSHRVVRVEADFAIALAYSTLAPTHHRATKALARVASAN